MTDNVDQARVNTFVEDQIKRLALEIESDLSSDVMAIVGPIFFGIEDFVHQAIESRNPKRQKLAIVLDTDGGIIEVVERMVYTIRHHYNEVIMIVPNRAMSAGTVFAMSGDSIMMDYFGCLGPTDPQIQRTDPQTGRQKLVPALSYLVQFERLKKRSESGEITSAELVLLQQLDLAELHTFEEARELSNSLLKQWLTRYKFKDWTVTETRQIQVTPEMRDKRALEIAEALGDPQRWHSHGRPISAEILRRDINLKIDDLDSTPELSRKIKDYYQFLEDYMSKIGAIQFVHSDSKCLAR